MARQISIESKKNIVHTVKQEIVINTDRISIDSVVDDGESVIANISFFHESGLTKQIILWDGIDYQNIGQWTDVNVDSRIKQILSL